MIPAHAKPSAKLVAELTSLNRICQETYTRTTTQDMVDSALKGMVESLSPDLALLYLVEGKTMVAKGLHAPGLDFPTAEDLPHESGKCLCGLTAEDGAPLFSLDIHKDPRCTNPECKRAGIHSYATLPLRIGEEIIGVIGLGSKEKRDFSDHADFLESLAAILSTGFHKARLLENAVHHSEELEERVRERTQELEETNVRLQQEMEERAKAEAAMRESETRFRKILESLHIGIVIIDPASHAIVQANDFAATMFGVSREKIVGKVCHNFICPNECGNCPITDQGKKVDNAERELLLQSGETLSILKTVTPILLDGREHLLESFIDTTDRRRAEEALKKTTEELSLIVDNLPLLQYICKAGDDFGATFVGPGLPGLTGYRVDEFLAEPSFWVDRIHPDDKERIVKSRPMLFANRRLEHEYWWRVADGSYRYFLDVLRLVETTEKHEEHILGVMYDITERKQAEEALKKSEERFRGYFELGLIGMAITSPEKGWIQFNDHLCEILGYSRDELGRMTWTELTHPEDIEADVAQFNRVLAGEIEQYSMDKRFIRKSGEIVFTTISAQCVRNPDNSINHFVAMVQEITERRLAEEALKESERKYRILFERSINAIFLVDMHTGRYLNSNKAGEILTGRSVAELRGLTTQDITPWGAKDRLKKLSSLTSSLEMGVVKYLRPDGTTREALLNIVPLGKDVIFGIAHDITERKQAEAIIKKDVERTRMLLDLGLMREASEEVLIQFALEEMVRLTDSEIGYLHFVDPDEENIMLCAWSRKALATSTAPTAARHPLAETGLWADCVKRRESVIHNEYLRVPGQKELPEWHPPVLRHMIVPILDGDRVAAVAGVCNKPGPYEDTDVRQMTLFTGKMWDLLKQKRAEKEIRRLANVVELSPTPIIITDSEARIQYVNPIFTEITGYSTEEAVGETPRLLKSGLHPPEFYETMWSTLLAGRTWRGEILNKKKNGELYWEDASIAPLIDEQGVVLNYIGVNEDITERKKNEERLQEALSEFEVLFENSAAGILQVKGDRRVHRINSRFTEILGYSMKEAVGQSVRTFHISDESFKEYGKSHYPALAAGNTVHAEYPLRRKDGSTVWCDIYGKALFPQDLEKGSIWVFMDITERKELEQLREDVERIMRHDLKSPLNGVIGLPEVMINDENLTPMQVEHLKQIQNAGYRMLNQISISLDLYKMETGAFQYEPEPMDSVDLLERLLHDLGLKAGNRGVRLEGLVKGMLPDKAAPLLFQGDETLCYTMLSNLLDNALDASPVDGCITLRLEEEPDAVTFSIHNIGAVPEPIRDTFFDKYATHGKTTGTGLGTYSAKLMAETQGGSIHMETSPEKGTTVTIRLPK
jgi:PAS domain S-box-containing protein